MVWGNFGFSVTLLVIWGVFRVFLGLGCIGFKLCYWAFPRVFGFRIWAVWSFGCLGFGFLWGALGFGVGWFVLLGYRCVWCFNWFGLVGLAFTCVVYVWFVIRVWLLFCGWLCCMLFWVVGVGVLFVCFGCFLAFVFYWVTCG